MLPFHPDIKWYPTVGFSQVGMRRASRGDLFGPGVRLGGNPGVAHCTETRIEMRQLLFAYMYRLEDRRTTHTWLGPSLLSGKNWQLIVPFCVARVVNHYPLPG